MAIDGSKSLITDTLDNTVRSTGFKATLQRNADDAKAVQAEKDRLARIEKDKKDQDDWTEGRKKSVDLIAKTQKNMTSAADAGRTSIDLEVAGGNNRTTETAYDRGLLDGLVTWLKNESFKFEVVRSSIAEDEAGPASYHLSVKASW